ncbi:MAG: hypothetical protein Q8O67_17885 [Deltaproteobacteria bacterium]|nr:hypothetical protein [Deltaproteobacteria bacterium]
MRSASLALALAVAVTACAANSEQVKAFFAPDFSTADDTKLQDGMWRLGRGVQDLDETFKIEGPVDGDRHARIVETLDIMAAAAASVKAPGARQGHTNVAMNIDKLIVEIAAAKTAAEAKDYAPAQALPASCLACHQGAGGGAQNR